MDKSTKISCVIITKNEEKNIERCILSIDGVADEIIIVDSFSTDRTEQICTNFNLKFVQTPWKGFAETKNYGNSLTSYSYILSIDADEALSENLKNEINNLKISGFDHDAYYIKRLTNYCGKWIRHCGWYPDKKLRLWNKELGSWKGHIHEEISLKTDCKISNLKGDLLHYSYYTINEHITQMISYTDLMAENNLLKGKNPSYLKMIISPLTKFLVSYFIRLGMLDGLYGFVISVLSCFATFLKYAKTKQLFIQRKNSIN
jgi:glycosyltransferase involved in cell wall biosynthesis